METGIFQFLPDDPLARVLGIFLILLIGVGGRGFLIALRKDRRLEEKDDVDLVERIKKLTDAELQTMRERQDAQARQIQQLEIRLAKSEARNIQLISFIYSQDLEPPKLPTYD